jgi:hypothetical protein
VPSIEVVPPVKVVLTPVEVQTFDVTVSAPNPVVQVVSEGPQGPTGDAATVDVGTVTVVNPDVPPDVVNSGTTADAVLDFDLPRAAAVSVGTTTTVGPADPAAVTDSGTDGDVVLDFDIPQGVQGDQGVEISAVEPENLTVLWADTSEEGDAVLPLGGAAGQSLVKVSGDDYDTTWADLDTDGVSEGTVNLYNRVPTGGTALQVLTKNSGTDFDASFEYPQFSWDYKSGEYYGPQTAASASGTRVNRIDALPVFFPRPITVDRISFRISAGGAAGSLVRLGIYSSGPDGLPSDLLHDFGTVDGTVPANPTEITISETLQGFLWLAARYNDNSPTIIVSSAVAAPWAPRNSGMTVHGAGILTAVLPSGDTLVDPFPISSAATGTSVTVMRVRAA